MSRQAESLERTRSRCVFRPGGTPEPVSSRGPGEEEVASTPWLPARGAAGLLAALAAASAATSAAAAAAVAAAAS